MINRAKIGSETRISDPYEDENETGGVFSSLFKALDL
jgi:hypothetical protein